MINTKTKQQKDGENILIRLVKLFISGKVIIRSGTVADDNVDVSGGSKRITFFVREKKEDK